MPRICPGGGGRVSGMGGGPDGGGPEGGVARLKKFVWLLSSVGGSGRAEKKKRKHINGNKGQSTQSLMCLTILKFMAVITMKINTLIKTFN